MGFEKWRNYYLDVVNLKGKRGLEIGDIGIIGSNGITLATIQGLNTRLEACANDKQTP